MTKAEMVAAAQAAGVTPDEMRDDPEHGLMLSASAVRKMAARRPDTQGKMVLMEEVNRRAPRS